MGICVPSIHPTTMGNPDLSLKRVVRFSRPSFDVGNMINSGPKTCPMAWHTLRTMMDNVHGATPNVLLVILKEPWSFRKYKVMPSFFIEGMVSPRNEFCFGLMYGLSFSSRAIKSFLDILKFEIHSSSSNSPFHALLHHISVRPGFFHRLLCFLATNLRRSCLYLLAARFSSSIAWQISLCKAWYCVKTYIMSTKLAWSTTLSSNRTLFSIITKARSLFWFSAILVHWEIGSSTKKREN